MNQNRKLLLLVFYLLVTSLTLLYTPRIERAESNPYFLINLIPIFYWMGFLVSISFMIIYLFSFYRDASHERKVDTSVFIISFIFLLVHIYVLPNYFYANRIYIDT